MSIFLRYDQINQKKADTDILFAYLLGHRVLDAVMEEIVESLAKYNFNSSIQKTLTEACRGDRLTKLCMLLVALWMGDVQLESNPIRGEKFQEVLNVECNKMINGHHVNIHEFVSQAIIEYLI